MIDYIKALAAQYKLVPKDVEGAVRLIDEGNTIPFIARYRKEATGSMDDQVLRDLADRLEYLRGLDKRREEVRSSIEEQGVMTSEILDALELAETLSAIEDIYRPYKPKRKTRASVARAKGLEPLAKQIFAQNTGDDPLVLAQEYINEENDVNTAEEALNGARDIIAEDISDTAALRARLREFYFANALLVSKAAKEEDSVYSGYYDFKESVKRIAGHRVLAINRGEREDFLKVSIETDTEGATSLVYEGNIKNHSLCSQQIKLAADDAYLRLIHPSMEREIRSFLTEKASEGAIRVFSKNLEQLLLAPPIKGKVAMALDPGYRMGCKVAVVDATGKVLDTAVIYPVPEFKRVDEAKRKTKELIKKYSVEIIAIGNGTAGRETEIFCAEVLHEIGPGVSYMVVNEAGASVYSASKLGAQEFPEFDVNVRSAISIARRMQDPLSELVKIDPKAVGVGQYQHDMPPAQLANALDGVVEYCVNTVGVDLNTASVPLLARVAGVTNAVAKNIIVAREEKGEFKSRKELLKVPKLGPKAYEQCAGFLRVPGAKEKLDATAVHPESYSAAEAILTKCGFTKNDIGTQAIKALTQKAEQFGMARLALDVGIGVPTLHDIIRELLRPGRDMRDELPAPILRTDVMDINDLKPGMELTGTVRNVIDFGAFIDIGVHQDGLVHVSQVCEKFIRHPAEVLKVGDVVKVWVISVEFAKKRISLTMKKPQEKQE